MQSTTTVHISLDHLLTSVDAARAATTEKRWLNALETAYDYLLQQDSVTLDADGALLVESATEPGKIYAANGSCQCTAYIGDRPCWHRACARLVKRMLERQRVMQHAAVIIQLSDAGEDAEGLIGAIQRCEGEQMAQAALKEVARLREQEEKARQVKALAGRLAERRRAHTEMEELYV